MILKTRLLFNDVLAEKYGTSQKEVWADFYIDLNEVSGFGQWIDDNEVVEGSTELMINGPWKDHKIC